MSQTYLDWRGDAPLPASLATTGRERLDALESSIETVDASALPGDAARVLACSDFVFSSCERYPSMLAVLVSSGDLEAQYAASAAAARGRPSLRERADSAARAAGSIDGLMGDLRRLRRREMVRIAWRDIGGLADFDETVRDTSDLADAIIDTSLDRLHEWQRADLGTPIDHAGEPQQLVVLALGKLGASELNFSSDIDLIFTFPENGQTEGGRRSVDNDRFFLQLARKLVKVLGEPTADGFVYRVDMRLRPFGTQGPLVLGFDALEEYYQTHGRDWERYALIRARAVSGDMVLAAELLERLRPFVYRRYIDFGTLQSLRSLKVVMEREVARKGMEHSVKHGPGGIREVEFTAQAFQMVRGGRTPALRYRRLLTVLARLGELGLLPAHAVESLSSAYRFLRAAEHRLQQVDDRQEHMLPLDDASRTRIAASMGYASWEAFSERLDRHRRNVDEQFAQVFGEERSTDAAAGGDPLGTLLEDSTDEATGVALLEDAGFAAAREAWSIVARYRDTIILKMPDALGHERLARLLPDLLRAIAAQTNATTTLERVMTVVESVAKRSVYLALLAERSIALSQFVQLCAASPWIAQLLGRHPVLFDELLDPRTLYAPLGPEELDRDIAERLTAIDDPDREHEMDCLRQSKQANVLRVAAADVSRRIPLMVVSDHLTAIAEAILRAALAIAWRDITARHGRPASMPGDAAFAPYTVIAYGKLGGIELGYGSDLDLVFVHDDDANAMTSGPKSIDLATFYARLTQRLIHILTSMTPQGALYEVDPRLRPDGSKGVLVNTLDGLGEYLRDKAWTWEHQALVRARAVAGDPGLGTRFADLRRDILLRDRDGDTLRNEVRTMRERMRSELGSRRSGRFDLKQDPGGVADIEFMVQYGTLRWASQLGAHLDFTDNIRLLEGFGLAGLMPDDDVNLLADAYRAYRGRIHVLSLQESEGVVGEEEFAGFRAAVIAIWNRLMVC